MLKTDFLIALLSLREVAAYSQQALSYIEDVVALLGRWMA